MRAFLERLLGDGYTAESRGGGAEARDWLLGGGEADLVVADLKMPGLDGFAFTETLRADARTARLPILVLSGSDKSEDRIRALRLGADDFVVKPFNPDELLARIENLLRRLG
jgi:DNA-binding response OmpR family regulator